MKTFKWEEVTFIGGEINLPDNAIIVRAEPGDVYIFGDETPVDIKKGSVRAITVSYLVEVLK